MLRDSAQNDSRGVPTPEFVCDGRGQTGAAQKPADAGGGAETVSRCRRDCASNWSRASRRSKVRSRWPSTRTAGSGSSRCATIPTARPRGQPPEGRIRILEDKDGDGFFETQHRLRRRAALRQRPAALEGRRHRHGRAAHRLPARHRRRRQGGHGEVLYEGFAAQNPQLRVSHPILGLDGWIYVANGLRGGKVMPRRRQANASRSTSAAWISAST